MNRFHNKNYWFLVESFIIFIVIIETCNNSIKSKHVNSYLKKRKKLEKQDDNFISVEAVTLK